MRRGGSGQLGKNTKKVNKEQEEHQKQKKEAFDNLMTYDFEVAIRRKR